jgi:coniferyl-aldehyde dehydrogenase
MPDSISPASPQVAIAPPDVREMEQLLQAQQADFLKEESVSLQTRRDRLTRLEHLLSSHRKSIVDAVLSDFRGHRSAPHTTMTEVAAPIAAIRTTSKHLPGWLRRESRPLPLLQRLLGARAEIHYQPIGSVGVMAPWNFPVYLSVGPLVGILAAGNRAMLKPSEYTPHTAALLQQLFKRYFSPTEVSVITGAAEISSHFSSLPFDHLVFTGSGTIAKKVMQAAAQNLVPLTLELGGKSPVIIGHGTDMARAARCIIDAKLGNAGQMCIAPDYILVPRTGMQELVAQLQIAAQTLYPSVAANPDYTAIINDAQYQRLSGYLKEAREAGVECIDMASAQEIDPAKTANKIVPTLLLEPDDSLRVMRDEIFGPLLPIKTYGDIDQALDFIKQRPRPLALYYFGQGNKAEREKVLTGTLSGGVCINDIAAHASCESLPFGGVGPSGMGAYHGIDGFRTFSHAKAIFYQSRLNPMDLFGLRPPYTRRYLKMLESMMGRSPEAKD